MVKKGEYNKELYDRINLFYKTIFINSLPLQFKGSTKQYFLKNIKTSDPRYIFCTDRITGFGDFLKDITKLEFINGKLVTFFDDYKILIENKEVNNNILDLIAKKVINKFPLINKGGCAQFALAINKTLGLDKFLFLYENKEAIDFRLPSHVCFDLGKYKAYDAEGIWPISELKQSYENNDLVVVEKANKKEVEEYRKELGDKYNQEELEKFIENIIKQNKVIISEKQLQETLERLTGKKVILE